MTVSRGPYGRLRKGASDDEARQRVLDAYEAAEGNTAEAARMLGVHKTTLLRSVRNLGISELVAERWPSRARQAFVPDEAC